jgi:hypothetical protein
MSGPIWSEVLARETLLFAITSLNQRTASALAMERSLPSALPAAKASPLSSFGKHPLSEESVQGDDRSRTGGSIIKKSGDPPK